jgi:hypothetical protein
MSIKKPSQKAKLERYVRLNESKKCSAKGCHNNRWRLSGYCIKHNQVNFHWGHPYGRHLTKDVLAKPTEEVTKVILKNLDKHNGIKNAIAFFEKWMKTAYETYVPHRYKVDCKKEVVPGSRYMSKMYADGNVTGLDCLIAVAAVWRLSVLDMETKKYILSDKHCIFCIGQNLLKLTRLSRGSRGRTGPERKYSGQYVMDNIGTLLVNISDAIQKVEDREEERVQSFQEELDTEGIGAE